jgi:hypothetical protein
MSVNQSTSQLIVTTWRLFLTMVCMVAVRGLAQTGTTPPRDVAAEQKVATAKLQVAAPTFNFGRIAAGTVLNHSYSLKNEGAGPLTITSVIPTCGCTTVEDFPAELGPGKTGTIPIRFDSIGLDGAITREVVIASNDPDQPEVTLLIEGTVYSSVTVSPTDAVFASLADASASETKVVQITNQTENPLVLAAPESNNPAFVAELKTVVAGKEFELRVTAVPPFGAGGTRGQIALKTNSPDRPVITVTTLVVVQKLVTVVPSGIWVPTPPTTQSRVTIRNNSGAAGFAISDPVVNLPGVTAIVNEVEPGRVFNVVLTFPSGFALPAGTQGELRIQTNHSRFPVVTVPIRPAPRRG